MNFDDMSTPELRSYVRRNDDLQDEAILALCSRKDSGDLIEFFASLRFQPMDVNAYIQKAEALAIPRKTTGAALGMTDNAVRHRVRDMRQMSDQRPQGRSPDTSDKTDTKIAYAPVVELPRPTEDNSCSAMPDINGFIEGVKSSLNFILKRQLTEAEKRKTIKILQTAIDTLTRRK